MQVSRVVLASLSVCAWLGGGAARADDDDIFQTQSVEPNVVILIDTSGSMNDKVASEAKILAAQNVVTDLLENVSGVRFGIFSFNETSDGGHLVSPIGTDIAEMVAAVDDLKATGPTPLGRATQDVQAYFKGLYSEDEADHSGGSGGWGTEKPSRDDETPGRCVDDEDDEDDEGGSCSSTVTFANPIQYHCQKNYAILVTDGMPNGEAEDLVVTTAGAMFTQDHNTTIPGIQNVTVFTVGFDIPAGEALLTQAATAGGGAYYRASNGAELQNALQDAMTVILTDSYSFALPLVPATTAVGGANAYVASFEPDATRPFWQGMLTAYTRDSSGRVPVDGDGLPLASAQVWEAGTLLAARAASTRTIYTAASGALTPFTSTNTSISFGALGVPSQGAKTKLVNFVRGLDTYDHDGDGNTTEEREWKLGDIYHSNPVLVFPPPLTSSDADYQSFKAAHANRTTIVLVGANDGMLHAFRASDGVELWAVIPPDMLSRLSLMTTAIGSHAYYADSTPVVADVKLNGTWKTIVLFGTRRGGKSYNALDITDTANPTWLWSFTDSEMGETWSEPAIGKIRISDNTERYVAFVGGGYNTTTNNASGRAFYAIDLASGTKLWKYGVGGSNDAQYMNFSMPASPTAVDTNGDGRIDRVYIGDVGGQLWKFDVSAAATLSSGVATNWTGKRLFVASPAQANPPAAGNYEPAEAMYGAPALSVDEYGLLWVFIGTGDRNRPNHTSQNRFYGIKDTTTMTNASALTSANLVDSSAGDEVTQGWYYELDANEKVLAAALVFNGVVYFSTYTPGDASDVCASADGIARLYALQMTTGLPGVDWTDGEPLEAPTGSEPASIEVGAGIPTQPVSSLGTTLDAIVVTTTAEEVTEVTMPSTMTKRVRYWREVY